MKIPGIDMAAQGTAAAAKPAAKPATGFAKQMAYAMEKNMGADLEPIFEKAAKQYGVPKDLLQAIGFHESGYQRRFQCRSHGDYAAYACNGPDNGGSRSL